MAPDSSFLLGEYGARLDALEGSVSRIDKNVNYLVERETVRDTREKQRAIYLATTGGFLGAIFAWAASIAKELMLR